MSAEGRVREFLGNNPGFYFVNKEVFWDCYVRIKPYLDNSLLFPVLMRHNLARDLDDLQRLTEPSHQPHQRHLALLELADRGGEYGYMLLFMCIHEANQSPGHEDAAKILQETGNQGRGWSNLSHSQPLSRRKESAMGLPGQVIMCRGGFRGSS